MAADVNKNSAKTDTNANTICSGTNTYLDGNGNCDSASTIVSAGGGPDIILEVWNSGTSQRGCVKQNLQSLCGDNDGCFIRIVMQHKTDSNDQVRMIGEYIYFEQPELSNKNGPGTYGWTRQIGGGEYSWITGTAGKNTLFEPWDWAWAFNYWHSSCLSYPSGSDAFSNAYDVVFMCHEHLKCRFIIYD